MGGKWNRVTCGERFGRLIAACKSPGKGDSNWLCLCDCGFELYVLAKILRSGGVQSCGCIKRSPEHLSPATKASTESRINRRPPVLGLRFGRLLVVEERARDVKCVCDCGSEKILMRSKLHDGSTRSCGCLRPELSSQRMIERSKRIRRELGLPEQPDQTKRNSLEQNRLRRATLKRDNRTCALCRTSPPNMVVHHIEGWKFREDLRAEITNLVSLCLNCHLTKAHGEFILPPVPEVAEVLKKYIENLYLTGVTLEKNGSLNLTPEEVSSTLAGIVPERVKRNWGITTPEECLKLAELNELPNETNNELEKVKTK